MFWIVSSIILFIGFILTRIGASKAEHAGDRKVAGYVSWGVLTVLVLLTLFSTVRVVGVGHAAVGTFGGNTTGSFGNGINVVPPWVSLTDFEVRVQEYTMAGNGDGEEAAAISAPTNDGSNLTVDVTLRYQVLESSVHSIFEQYGSGSAFEDKVIFNDVRTEIRNVVVQYDALEARQNREALGIEVADRLTERWEGLVRVEVVNIRRVVLDPTVQDAANRVLEAEESARARTFDEERERTNANIARIQAQGVADSQQIIICGGTVQVTDDGTETVIPNEGDSCQEQLSQELLVWKYIEALEAIGADGNQMFIVTSDGDAVPEIIVNTPENAPVAD